MVATSSTLLSPACSFTYWSPQAVHQVQLVVASILQQLTAMATLSQMRRLMRRGLLPVLAGSLKHQSDAVKELGLMGMTNLLVHERMQTYLHRES